MIFNKDNFFEEMGKFNFEEELIKSSILIAMENYEPTHFFVYQNFDEDFPEELINIDIVFCTKDDCYNIYLILDTDDVIIDFEYNYAVNIKILEEKL